MKAGMDLRLLRLSCAALLVAGVASIGAQSSNSMAGSGDKSSMASSADKKFVTSALKGGMAEVALGKMAAESGNSQDVKDFGQKMVTDHTKLDDQMKMVAGQIGVDVPTMKTMGDDAEEAKLKVLTGDAFDKAYIKAMVKDHKQDLAAFNKEISGGKSTAVKSAAMDGKKVISEHLDTIQTIAKSHGVGSKSTM